MVADKPIVDWVLGDVTHQNLRTIQPYQIIDLGVRLGSDYAWRVILEHARMAVTATTDRAYFSSFDRNAWQYVLDTAIDRTEEGRDHEVGDRYIPEDGSNWESEEGHLAIPFGDV